MNTQLFKKALLIGSVILTSLSASKIWLRAFVLVVIVLIAGPTKVAAYDVCSDGPCTHEIMTDYGFWLYNHLYNQAGVNPYAGEMGINWWAVREGAGIPDEYDPLYYNTGIADALVTITHFWDLDDSLGAPMEFMDDDYPNAFNVAQALWTRALGEYAAAIDNEDNEQLAGYHKVRAYRYLGMIAHFLGDMTVPAHVKNDEHGTADDQFECWMNSMSLETGESGPAHLSTTEKDHLKSLAKLANHKKETHDQLLLLFLNTNQVADCFASDDYDGDYNWPSDPVVAGVDGYMLSVETKCDDEPGDLSLGRPPGCPITTGRLEDNDHYACGWDIDGDLGLIRKYSYLFGIRAIAALFAMWEKAITKPILVVKVHEIRERGYDDGVTVWGLDDAGYPDFYVGMVMGYNERECSSGCPAPVGAYLKDSDAEYREIDYEWYPANVTRRAGALSYEDKTVITPPNFKFGQAYSYSSSGPSEYVSGSDVVNIFLSVWDHDDNPAVAQPYWADDIADINPVAGLNILNIQVDLAKCLSGTEGAVTIPGVTIPGVNHFNCNSKITTYGEGDKSQNVGVVFSVSMFQADALPPDVTCDAADGFWHETDVSIYCTAVDDGSGLENPADATFWLSTNVPSGTETDNAATGTKEVCDAFGNCATAGPVNGNMVDKKAPEITCAATDGVWHGKDVSISCTAVDDGSGLAIPADATFWLSTNVPSGTETDNAATGTKEVCDAFGNCATAGPVNGNKVDKKAPEITCAATDGVWHGKDVSISCTAVDDGSGLAIPADATFWLSTNVPSGTETDNAATGTKEVCDAFGNCATAGPVSGNKVDKKAPVITIVQPATAQYVHSETLLLDYTVTDNGSGVSTVTPTMNGSTTVAGNGLPSGQAINLLTSLPLGANTFTVNAVDNVDNASPPASVTFTIIVTPQSMIDAVNQFQTSDAIGQKAVKPLLAKLRNAMAKQSKGQCGPAGNMYGAFINQVQAQSGKSITPIAAGILIADALYLIAHCP